MGNNFFDEEISGITPEWFPTKMQAFIFRNWNMIDKSRIADTLGTTVENVEKEARRMGLGKQKNTEIWQKKGYINILRSNWHLISQKQLLALLGWTEEKLALTLKEDDFLGYKLGYSDPKREDNTYCELTNEQKLRTEKIKKIMDEINHITPDNAKEPFDFAYSKRKSDATGAQTEEMVLIDDSWNIVNETSDDVVDVMAKRFKTDIFEDWSVNLNGDKNNIILSYIADSDEEYHEIFIDNGKIEIKAGGSAGILRGLYRLEDLMQLSGGPFLSKAEYKRKPRFGSVFIYSFCGLYNTAFDVDSREYCPDSLLEQYARVGINGIWLQAVLYRLIEFPFDSSISVGWEKRQENLRSFIKRAKTYGIKIYLYINEPRYMPLSFFEKYPQLLGSVSNGRGCMCTETPETRKYLKNAISDLCRSVKGIGGFFTICLSENMTHCKSVPSTKEKVCERCKDKAEWELVADVNNMISEAVKSVDPSIKVIAWDWSWYSNMASPDEDIEKCVNAISKDVAIMCKRECAIPFTRGGISDQVVDYSLSVDGLSEISKKAWNAAKKTGHEIAAKLQINNTWECSTTPYLPIYRKIFNQFKEISDMDIKHLMLSWTLGGYPSPSIRLISEGFFIENGKTELDFDESLKIMYGKNSEKVKLATDLFSEAFGEFPFNGNVIYYGPQNGGPSNILYRKPTGYKGTMTCYAFDDLTLWRGTYSEDYLEEAFKTISEKWKEGLSLLPKEEQDLYNISFVSYSLFRSAYNQVRFIRLRDRHIKTESKELINEIITIVNEERDLAKKLYKIMCLMPEVGYEAANHYYFSLDNMKEKILNCDFLLEYYEKLL